MIRRAVLPLGAGLLMLLGAIVVAWNPGFLESLVRPPPLVRATLVGGSVAIGLILLGRALMQIEASRRPGAEHDIPMMVRGIRLAFLAVAAFAGATGWMMGEPLPLVVGLVIAGIDVVETSFLMLVTR